MGINHKYINVDNDNDIALFDRIAKKYCSKDMIKSTQISRQHRLYQTVKAIPGKKIGRLLEVGCGAGFTATYLSGYFDSFTGVDYSKNLIEIAKKMNNLPNVEFIPCDISKYYTSELFDVVLMIGVIHHFKNIFFLLNHINSLVKPGGWIVANEPQFGNMLFSCLRSARKIVDKSYSDEQLEISANDLIQYFQKASLESVSIHPQGFLSTPFAEVILPCQTISSSLSNLACSIDSKIEHYLKKYSVKLSWNLIACGRKPEKTNEDD